MKSTNHARNFKPAKNRHFHTGADILGEEHPSTLVSLYGLLGARYGLKQYPEAETAARESIAGHQRKYGETHSQTHSSKLYLARIYMVTKRNAEASPILSEVLEIRTKGTGPVSAPALEAASYQAWNEDMLGNKKKALALAEEGLKRAKEHLGTTNSITKRFQTILDRLK